MKWARIRSRLFLALGGIAWQALSLALWQRESLNVQFGSPLLRNLDRRFSRRRESTVSLSGYRRDASFN
jgi:hypothetical protein